MLKNTASIYVISALLITGAGYFVLSNNQSADRSADSVENNGPAADAQPPSQYVDSVAIAAQRLRDKLEQNPNSPRGWVLLGRAYHHLKQWNEAELAFEKAKQFGYTGPVPEAESAAPSNPHRNAANPHANPHMPLLASSISATIAKKSQSTRTADVSNDSGENGANGIESVAQANLQANTHANSSSGAKTASGKPFDEGIAINVSVSPSIRERISPDDTVFIFARAASGPRMPLAVVKKQVKDLPLTITLDDTMSMMPSATLSNADAVVIGVRVSKSGDVKKNPGDFEIFSTTIKEKPEQPIKLEVSRRVE